MTESIIANIPIVCIVGRSKSGKTTVLEKLIRELKRRGYQVATIKHHSHPGIEIDRPGKEPWRHAQAGSDQLVIAAPDRVASIRRVDREPALEEIAADIHGVDVILAEGYKRTGQVKVDPVRAARCSEPLCEPGEPGELLALVTDVDIPCDVPQFGLDDACRLPDLVETLL